MAVDMLGTEVKAGMYVAYALRAGNRATLQFFHVDGVGPGDVVHATRVHHGTWAPIPGWRQSHISRTEERGVVLQRA